MKIAIQGHPTRGKEVIQILESLGGNNGYDQSGSNEKFVYFINSVGLINSVVLRTCLNERRIYTLEEFEKEFPFKIGDEVTIVGLPDFPKVITQMVWDCDEVLYSFEGLNSTWFGTKSLKRFKMKEERNITLTLEKAKEWYNKGGELREIALQAFSENELNPLPRSWEEFCKNGYWHIGYPEKYKALFKLEKLRDCWRQGWEPNWLNGNESKHVIKRWRDKSVIETTYVTRAFLSFPTYEMAKEFLECFRDLIEQAGDLI